MRIISKTKDFYDVGMRQGMDKSLVFVREELADTGKWLSVPRPANALGTSTRRYRTEKYDYELAVHVYHVIFCGKFYERFVGEVKRDNIGGLNPTKTYFGGPKRRELMHTMVSAFDLAPAHRIQSRVHINRYYHYNSKIELEKDNKFYEFMNNRKWSDDHCEFKTPLLTLRGYDKDKDNADGHSPEYWRGDDIKLMIVKNPNLADMFFFQEIDPFTCYQEIAMYLGGVIGQQAKPMVVLSDIERVQKAGFDKKLSFRKAKAS
jgi:hypothetical protein